MQHGDLCATCLEICMRLESWSPVLTLVQFHTKMNAARLRLKMDCTLMPMCVLVCRNFHCVLPFLHRLQIHTSSSCALTWT